MALASVAHDRLAVIRFKWSMETQRVKRPKDPKYKKYTKGVDKTWQDMARLMESKKTHFRNYGDLVAGALACKKNGLPYFSICASASTHCNHESGLFGTKKKGVLTMT